MQFLKKVQLPVSYRWHIYHGLNEVNPTLGTTFFVLKNLIFYAQKSIPHLELVKFRCTLSYRTKFQILLILQLFCFLFSPSWARVEGQVGRYWSFKFRSKQFSAKCAVSFTKGINFKMPVSFSIINTTNFSPLLGRRGVKYKERKY